MRCFARSLKTKSSAILTFLNLDLDPVVLKSYKTYFSVMGQFSVQQRAFCVGHYMSSSSPSMTIRKFRSRYGKNVSTPSRQSILTWVEKFRHLGSLENQNVKSRKRPSHSGRPRTARTQLNFNRVQESVEECHETSARRRSLQLGLSLSSTLRILKSDLNLTPYHIQVKQKLRDVDKTQRVTMCQWFMERHEGNEDFLDDVWFSDESHFHLSGYVNAKSAVYWDSQPPPYCLQRPLHAEKCTVWVALSMHGLIGPFFFEDDDGQTATVNADRYIGVLNEALGKF